MESTEKARPRVDVDVEDLVLLRIRELARKKGRSVSVLAELAGISRGHMSRLMNRKGSPTLRTLKKLAAELDVEVADLLTDRQANK